MQLFKSQLSTLHKKSWEVLKNFSSLPQRDYKKAYLEIVVSQINTSFINLMVNLEFSEQHPKRFSAFFDNNPTIQENYLYSLQQNIRENIVDTLLFQTELLLRFVYAKITLSDVKETNMNKIFAKLFDDVENNWEKEECNLLVLFWTLRNTIHTGGIYSDKPIRKIIYKGNTYKFERGKAPDFMKDNLSFDLIFDLLDCMKKLFESDKIIALGSFEHPNYFALIK